MKSVIMLLMVPVLILSFAATDSGSFTVTGFNHIESVAAGKDYLFAADIGKELNPSAKDGDGRIIRLDRRGKIVDSSFTKEVLNAPKGLAISGQLLLVADIDRLIAFDIKTGAKRYEIVFSDGVSFLNDIAVADQNTVYVSATDKNKIYMVNLLSKSYTELVLNTTIAGVNGLFYDKKSNRLYVNGFGSENKPNGIVGYIDLTNNQFKRLADIEGYFDGIWLRRNTLYVSNWVAFEKKGIIQTIDILSGQVSEVKLNAPIAGPADFTITGKQIIVPEMMTGAIHFISLK